MRVAPFPPRAGVSLARRSLPLPAPRTASFRGAQSRPWLADHIAPFPASRWPGRTRAGPQNSPPRPVSPGPGRCRRRPRAAPKGARGGRARQPAELRGADYDRAGRDRPSGGHATRHQGRSAPPGDPRRRRAASRPEAGGLHALQAGRRGDHELRPRRQAPRRRPRAGGATAVCHRPARPDERRADPRHQRRRTSQSPRPPAVWRREEIPRPGGGRAHSGNPRQAPPRHRPRGGNGPRPARSPQVTAQAKRGPRDGSR
jgi:hypothetical protein